MTEYICKFEEEYGFLKADSMEIGDELIRCKDCKAFCRDDWIVDKDGMMGGYGECTLLVIKGADFCETIVHESHYCGWSERKEE